MPWTIADVDAHIKDLTDAQKKVWVKVANERLAACLKDDGKRETCEASAIRQANAAAKGVKESAVVGFREAATIKSRIQALIRAADGYLADKTLPKPVHDEVSSFRTKLQKRFEDLSGEGKEGVKANEAVGQFLTEAKTIIDVADSFNALDRLVADALKAKYPPPVDAPYERPWIREMMTDKVIYSLPGKDSKLMQASYNIDRTSAEPKVLLGEPVQVELAYITVEDDAAPAQEAQGDAAFAIDFIPLVEKAVRKDGTASLKIIEPGWGSSGYYPTATLERDGPKVFKAGTQMYWDHPTASEQAERPERSLRDLAGQLMTDAVFKADGPAGAGLYAEAKVYGPYKEVLNELGADIGTSIRGIGKGKQGTVEGRTGPVIERLVAAQSVDFVTRPGAGGQVLQLFEAARGRSSPLHISAVTLQDIKQTRPDLVEEMRADLKAAVYSESGKAKEARQMDETQIRELTEAKTALQGENAGLKQQILLGEAERFVAEHLKAVTLPDLTKKRLTESLVKAPVVKDGKLDVDGYKAAIEAAVKAEADYLAKVTESGKIVGMGAGEPAPVKLQESWERFYAAQGKSPDEAKRLAALAAGQRR